MQNGLGAQGVRLMSLSGLAAGWDLQGAQLGRGTVLRLAENFLLIDFESILEGCRLSCWSKWAADQRDLGLFGFKWSGQGEVLSILLARNFQHEIWHTVSRLDDGELRDSIQYWYGRRARLCAFRTRPPTFRQVSAFFKNASSCL